MIVAGAFGGGLALGLGLVFITVPIGQACGRRWSDYMGAGRRASDRQATRSGDSRRATDQVAQNRRGSDQPMQDRRATAAPTPPDRRGSDLTATPAILNAAARNPGRPDWLLKRTNVGDCLLTGDLTSSLQLQIEL